MRWALVPLALLGALMLHRVIVGRRMIRAMRAYEELDLSDLDFDLWSDR